jgi:hypothetical protein
MSRFVDLGQIMALFERDAKASGDKSNAEMVYIGPMMPSAIECYYGLYKGRGVRWRFLAITDTTI